MRTRLVVILVVVIAAVGVTVLRGTPGIPFWQRKSLAEMTDSEWESLCDGCGRCCLNKLRDADTDEIIFTNLACKQLDLRSCRCKDYANRKDIVPDCVQLTSRNIRRIDWLPETQLRRLRAALGPPTLLVLAGALIGFLVGLWALQADFSRFARRIKRG